MGVSRPVETVMPEWTNGAPSKLISPKASVILPHFPAKVQTTHQASAEREQLWQCQVGARCFVLKTSCKNLLINRRKRESSTSDNIDPGTALFTLHTSHSTLRTALFALETSHCTLHTPQFISSELFSPYPSSSLLISSLLICHLLSFH